MLDEEPHLEAGHRAPDAPDMLRVGSGNPTRRRFLVCTDHGVTVLVFVSSLVDATLILGALGMCDKRIVYTIVVLPSSASASVTSVGISC